MPKNFLTPAQVAERLGITTRRVQTLLGQGRFPSAQRVGERWIVPESAIAAYLSDAHKTTRPGVKPVALTRPAGTDPAALDGTTEGEND